MKAIKSTLGHTKSNRMRMRFFSTFFIVISFLQLNAQKNKHKNVESGNDTSFVKEEKKEIIAEKRDTVNYGAGNENDEATKKESKTETAAGNNSIKPIEKLSWNEKKRKWMNRWEYEQAQRRNKRESGDQIRRKNRKEEKYIASPTG